MGLDYTNEGTQLCIERPLVPAAVAAGAARAAVLFICQLDGGVRARRGAGAVPCREVDTMRRISLSRRSTTSRGIDGKGTASGFVLPSPPSRSATATAPPLPATIARTGAQLVRT
eukprot:GHVU01181024.1.p2 GENE.GHVU01181024.1~~GHVU01181024.1.p2  ORF type:complete len:115 (+),score=9.14 GHVU01181024.1:513-857(+)